MCAVEQVEARGIVTNHPRKGAGRSSAGSENENEADGEIDSDLERVGDEHATGRGSMVANGGVETSCSQSDDDEHEEDEDAVDSAGDVGLVGTERERVCAGGWGNTPLSMHAPDWLSLRLL